VSYTSPYPWSRSVRWCLAEKLVNGDHALTVADVWEVAAHLSRVRDDALYKYMFTFIC